MNLKGRLKLFWGKTESADQEKTVAFSALRNRDFRLLWIGSTLSHIGDDMQMVAVSWLVMLITNSPMLMGVANMFQGLPRLVFGLVGGLISDRMDRRKLLLIYQTSEMCLAFFFAFLVLSDRIKFWHILVLLPLFGFLRSVYQVCRQVFVFDLVGKDDLMNALAVNSSGMQLAGILGPSISGLLIGALGVGWCILINAISYIPIIISIIMMRPVKAGPKKEFARTGAMRELGETFLYLKGQTTLLFLFLATLTFVTFGLQMQIIMPLFARNILHVGASGYGFLISAIGAGAMCGALLMATLGDVHRKGFILLLTFFLYGLLLIFFSLSRWFYLSLVIIFCVGMMQIFTRTLNQTLLQLHVSDAFRGRVLGVNMLQRGFKPLGGFLMGASASFMGAPLALSLGAGICMFIALTMLLKAPRLREL